MGEAVAHNVFDGAGELVCRGRGNLAATTHL
jgi:hypothetical protein